MQGLIAEAESQAAGVTDPDIASHDAFVADLRLAAPRRPAWR